MSGAETTLSAMTSGSGGRRSDDPQSDMEAGGRQSEGERSAGSGFSRRTVLGLLLRRLDRAGPAREVAPVLEPVVRETA